MAIVSPPGQPLTVNKKAPLPRFSSWVCAPQKEFEEGIGFLEVTRGCSHNMCTYCTYYKEVPYSRTPKDHVEYYLEFMGLESQTDPIHRVFLQGANAFHLSYDELMEIRDMIYKYLPDVESIGGFARATDLKDKTTEQLHNLREAGYNRLAIGVDTADDVLLQAIYKGYSSEDLYEQTAKLKEAGISWIGKFMLGLGGHDYGPKSALDTAAFFNVAQPEEIEVLSLSLLYDKIVNVTSPLMQEAAEGNFTPAYEIERYDELRTFIEALECKTYLQATNYTMPYGLAGSLPDGKAKLLEIVGNITSSHNEEMLREFRRQTQNKHNQRKKTPQ